MSAVVVSIPDGFKVIGTSQHAPYAAISNAKKRFYGVQFHPEVVHTLNGSTILKNFTHSRMGMMRYKKRQKRFIVIF